jgi:putative phosphoribosyl transferase
MNADRQESEVMVPVGPAGRTIALPGTLAVPARSRGLVVFAHGSGSSRLSIRNRAVAAALADGGCATLLFDLLTPEEALDRANVFDVRLLGGRVVEAVSALREGRVASSRLPRSAPIGLFGASTGAAAALIAAAELAPDIAAVVSRGGRPDLAAPWLSRVAAPTLFIVGERDDVVLDLNRQAAALIPFEREILVIPGATHLFEEPGALEQVAAAALEWFSRHLAAAR